MLVFDVHLWSDFDQFLDYEKHMMNVVVENQKSWLLIQYIPSIWALFSPRNASSITEAFVHEHLLNEFHNQSARKVEVRAKCRQK